MLNHEKDLSGGLPGRLPDARRIARVAGRPGLTTMPTSRRGSRLFARTRTLSRGRRNRFELRALTLAPTCGIQARPKRLSFTGDGRDVLDDPQDRAAVVSREVPDLGGDGASVFARAPAVITQKSTERAREKLGELPEPMKAGRDDAVFNPRNRFLLHLDLVGDSQLREPRGFALGCDCGADFPNQIIGGRACGFHAVSLRHIFTTRVDIFARTVTQELTSDVTI
ncbi:hypothetical protein AWB69_00304 [Caballeronia udeis]|uniref:Uncharacterized protein n=1 Tax=Caballeronia udeis TaxID=1232866 RepID=A0A158EV76_9BURK|nr:hypothetical protein AWB69_00304 [Caballeronia udeis]